MGLSPGGRGTPSGHTRKDGGGPVATASDGRRRRGFPAFKQLFGEAARVKKNWNMVMEVELRSGLPNSLITMH